MVGNRIFLGLEPDPLTPASLSKNILTDLLRKQMGFQGVIITDTLQKDVLAKINRTVPEAAIQAFQAGADLLLLGSDQAANQQAIQAVLQSARDGQISIQRLNEAAGRILQAKTKYAILQPAPVDPQSAAQKIGRNPDAARKAAEKSITLLRDTGLLLPIQADEKILVVQTPAGRGLGSLLLKDFIDISEQPGAAEIEQVLAKTRDYQKVIVVSSDAGRNPQQVQLIQAVQAQKIPLIVVAASGPFDLMWFKDVGTYVVTYGMPSPTLRALADFLNGIIPPSGHLPIALPRLYQVGDGMTVMAK
jgi:beta-N-acetylhexosaminidase